MTNPSDDHYLEEACIFLKKHVNDLDPILGPHRFLEFFPGTYHYNVSHLFQAYDFAFVVIQKQMIDDIDERLVSEVVDKFHAVFASDVFVIYSKDPIPNATLANETEKWLQLLNKRKYEVHKKSKETCAAVITTFERPGYLERSLPQILALGVPVVVVDDGSRERDKLANQRIAERHDVPLIPLPSNRGLPNAINVGIGYWLADPEVEWISYFQDDVDVRADALEVLSRIQDAEDRPLLTGIDDAEHVCIRSESIFGHKVLLKRSATGRHLHAHRDYWASVLPIPTPYLGAPKPYSAKPGQGADEDWWITAWSPSSVTKRGKHVICIPGLVSTFDIDGRESTWQKPTLTQKIRSRLTPK